MARSTNHGKNSLWRSGQNKSNLWVGSWWHDTPNSKSSYSEIQHLPEHLAEEKLWHTTNDSGRYGLYFCPVWQDDPQTSQEIIYLQGVRHLWLWPVCPYPIWTKTWVPRWYILQVLHHPWYYVNWNAFWNKRSKNSPFGADSEWVEGVDCVVLHLVIFSASIVAQKFSRAILIPCRHATSQIYTSELH